MLGVNIQSIIILKNFLSLNFIIFKNRNSIYLQGGSEMIMLNKLKNSRLSKMVVAATVMIINFIIFQNKMLETCLVFVARLSWINSSSFKNQ